jgi:predicted transcriptional regulator
MSNPKHIYTVRLDPDTVAQLDIRARRLGVSRGEVIRRYINDGLGLQQIIAEYNEGEQ